MVFESVLVDLMNRYLGDFIENLDPSQLKIGIWGGDVVLNNLYVKETALDDLDLPMKVLHGNIGKLTLKIPWKNLYGAPTVATLEGLYVVAVPKIGVKYNAEKEDKAAWDSKQKELQRIEDAKKAEADKNKPKEEKVDSFGEKLATNIIKNLQVEISNIHIRYEDRFTNPQKPVSLGVTLRGLSFQTTDENWTPTIIKESVSKIFKMIRLDSLAMYWNSKSPSYLGLDKQQMLMNLQNNIIGSGQKSDYQYLIEPITSSAQLQLHTKPEQDHFSIPKILLNVVMEQISIALSKNQYQDVMEMLESFERLAIASKYRKFRPDVPKKGNSKAWWHFAYNCVLEDQVRRRHKMWSWPVIQKHQQLCRQYKANYKKKLGLKKIPKDLQTLLETAEKELSVLNVTLLRRQAEMEAKKEGIKPGGGGGGWFGGWFGGKKDDAASGDKTVGDQFAALMSPEEKAKMYEAIGYQETAADPTLPKEYIATKMNFKLKNLKLSLVDKELRDPQVMNLQLQDMAAQIGQRPAASAIAVDTTIESFTVTGAPPMTGGPPPSMVSSQLTEQDQKYSLLDAQFETNPLDGSCDTRVKLNARPLEIIYDAQTINLIADFFKPPESVHLKQLQAAAMAKFEELKEQTATGLQHAISQRKYTELTVNIKPTHVIMPDKGSYHRDCQMLVLDLGQLSISTEKQQKGEITSTLDFDEVMKRAYDKFNFKLSRIQLLYAKPGDDWKVARSHGNSPLHILRPMDLNVSLSKCMIQDSRIPKMKIVGDLPKLDIGISDECLHNVVHLLQGVPFPQGAPAQPEDALELDTIDVSHMAMEGNADMVVRRLHSDGSSPESSDDEFFDASENVVSRKKIQRQKSEYVNMTDIILQFEIKEICVLLSHKQMDQEVPMVKLVIDSLGTEVKVCTFDLSVHAYLGGIYLQHMQFKAQSGGPLVNLINTPITDESTFKLLTVKYLKANKKGPEFATTYKNTEQQISVNFSALEVLLHQEAILNLMAFAQKLQPQPTPVPPGEQIVAEMSTPAMTAPPGHTADTEEKKPERKRRQKPGPEVIDIAVEAMLDVLAVAICTDRQLVTDLKIKGVKANVTVQKSKTCVDASLKDISVFDPTQGALYPKILAFEDEQVFQLNIVAYNGATDGAEYCNMQVADLQVALSSGTMRVVFLNKFINSLLNFLNQFQMAKDAMAEASAAARDSAVMAATELSQKATRISLNIKLKAPVIVVPQNSMSNNALIIDLGRINIANKFEIVGKRNKEGLPGVLDKMTIELTDLKLSRALMMGTDCRAECLLLEPVSLQLSLVRNLSASWYHGHPDIEASGKLKSFSVGISQGDYASIMSVLNENLTEGQGHGQGAAPIQPPVEGATQQLPSHATPTSQRVQPSPQQQQQQQQQPQQQVATPQKQPVTTTTAARTATTIPEVWSKVKFSFTIESIKLELYNGDSSLSSGFSARDAKLSLGRIQLQSIGLCGNIKSNNAIEARVMLYKCVLDDTRPGRENGITKGNVLRMVEHSSQISETTNPPYMIALTFLQSANQDKDVDITVSGLYICVCLEYLMALGDFFTKAQPTTPPSHPKPAIGAATDVPIQQANAPSQQATPSHAAPKPAEPTSEPAPEPAPEGEMKVRIVIDKPEIVMVENPLKYDTNALILDVQVLFELTKSRELMYAKGTISQLQIVSCVYSPEKRDSTRCLILSPVDITLFSKDYLLEYDHKVDITVTDVNLSISPASIRTITATLSSLSPAKVEEVHEALHGIPSDLWQTCKWTDFDFWFLKSETEETLNKTVTIIPPDTVIKQEQLILQASRIVVKMEGGVGRKTVPFILTEMAFTAEVLQWSSKMAIGAELSLEVAYYNEGLAVWEPLIEPVEEEGKGYRPWELKLKIAKNTPELLEEELDENGMPIVAIQSQMAIEVRSADILETTITKTALEVLSNLGKSFGDAYMLVELEEKSGDSVAPYVIKNDSGTDVTVRPDESFKLAGAKATTTHMEMNPGDRLELYDRPVSPTSGAGDIVRKKNILNTGHDEQQRTLYFVMEQFAATRELRVGRAQKVAFGINQRAYPGEVWHLVCQTDTSYGCKLITLRSVLQVRNHLPFAVELYYKLSDDCKGRCGEVKEESMLNVPMDAVYAAPYELFFKPRDSRYLESVDGFKWQGLAAGSQTIVSCQPSKSAQDVSPLYFNVQVEVEDILFEATGEKTAKTYTLHLHPALGLRNLLPMPISYTVGESTEEIKVEGGERKNVMYAKPGQSLTIKMDYHSKQWVCTRELELKPEELSVWSFEAMENDKKISMDLGIHTSHTKGYPEISLYCPYWMVNKTGRDLIYKSGDDFVVTHPSNHQGAVMFSFKSKSFFAKKKDDSAEQEVPSKKGNSLKRKTSSRSSQKPPSSKNKATLKKGIKASLKIGESEWSDKFSLDTVGSAGTVACKFKGLNYTSDVGVKITLGSSGLTKIVTFTPYYMLINQAKFTISCREVLPETQWVDIGPEECVPFWPMQTEKKIQMISKVKDTSEETKPFYFNQAHTTLLQLGSQYCGINVECQVMESAINVVYNQYHPGYATARIVNHTASAPIRFHQSQKDVKDPSDIELAPGDTMMYTWENPLEKRELVWSCGDKKNQKCELVKDDQGNFLFSADYPIYWLSFLDGMQRVLLFTDNLEMVLKIEKADLLELVDQDITVALHGLGLSLVNNIIRREVAYISITSSGAIWEEKKKKHFKPLKGKINLLLEDAWTKYRVAMVTGMEVASKLELDGGKLVIDFKEMQMFKPHKNKIRRQYQDGLWLQFRDSAQQTSFHVKINRIQLDNQIPGAVFPTVIAPIPPPKSVAAESDPKPFTEVSIMIRKREFSTTKQFKYFKVLVQEMAVKVDQGFINALLQLFSSGKVDEEQERIAFVADCDLVKAELMTLAVQSSAQDQKHYYDQMHFSPLKVHLSFSMTGSSGDEELKVSQTNFNVIGLFLQSVGVVLSDIDDVIFKLGYFERNYTFYNQSQLTREITWHYSQQAIKQMYVLVLGLDVLGNPFGLIRGLADGIEDLFYEPYQGAIQGPEEFAEGLALGMRSLFGHAVGGAAGAVSRMTGALGKGIASLTMDDDYQRKRREQLNKKPADLKEGLARGGKGLVMGLVDGVTGIVTKPVEGAKQEGAAGFFKGVGKGMIGVVTRPASGVVDFASSSFEGIKRATEFGDEVRRIRPPRYLHGDLIVRAFNYNEAEGNEIMADIDKGKYVKTDSYIAHVIVTKDMKNVLLVTDKRVVFASKGEIFGHWDTDWAYLWDELKEPPNVTTKGIQVLLKEKQKKSFFSTGTVGKLIPLLDKKRAEWVVKKMHTAMLKES